MNKDLRFLPTHIDIKLSDPEVRQALEDENSVKIAPRVQLLRTGAFSLADGNKVEITPEMLQIMLSNFKNKARGVDLAIDYKHDSDDIAAGWIRELEIVTTPEGETQLWAEVDWTPQGLRKLAEKEFRYLSADFNLNYRDNESLKEFGPTLFGAGLTNRPVVKNMEPAVALTEQINQTNQGRSEMDLQEKLNKAEAENKKLAEANKKLAEDNEKLAGDAEKLQEMEMTPEQMLAKIKELEAKLAAAEEKLAASAQAAELAEKEKKFETLLSEGKAVPAQKDAWLKGDLVKFAELSGDVNLEGEGNSGEPAPAAKGDSAESKVIELAQKKVAEGNGKVLLHEAISEVLAENPKLNEEYEKNSLAG